MNLEDRIASLVATQPEGDLELDARGLPAHHLPRAAGVVVRLDRLGVIGGQAGEDADAEHRRLVNPAVGDDRVEPGQDLPDDDVDVVLVRVQRELRLRPLGHGQVEQLDAGPGLADVDPDD